MFENYGNYRVSGPRVRIKVESDPDPFTYRGLNKDPGPVFNGSEPSSKRRSGDPFASIVGAIPLGF